MIDERKSYMVFDQEEWLEVIGKLDYEDYKAFMSAIRMMTRKGGVFIDEESPIFDAVQDLITEHRSEEKNIATYGAKLFHNGESLKEWLMCPPSESNRFHYTTGTLTEEQIAQVCSSYIAARDEHLKSTCGDDNND